MIILTALLITLSVAAVGWLMFSVGDIMLNATIKRAIRKNIVPYLEKKGLTFLDYRFDSLVQSVNFIDENSKPKLRFYGSRGGSPDIPIYIMIKYKCGDDVKKVAVRIDTSFLVIRKVTFDREP